MGEVRENQIGIKGVVIVRFDECGEIHYRVVGGEAVRLFIVDERCPDDRVYEWTQRAEAGEVAAILGDSPIGHSRDDKHAGIEAQVLGYQNGKWH